MLQQPSHCLHGSFKVQQEKNIIAPDRSLTRWWHIEAHMHGAGVHTLKTLSTHTRT